MVGLPPHLSDCLIIISLHLSCIKAALGIPSGADCPVLLVKILAFISWWTLLRLILVCMFFDLEFLLSIFDCVSTAGLPYYAATWTFIKHGWTEPVVMHRWPQSHKMQNDHFSSLHYTQNGATASCKNTFSRRIGSWTPPKPWKLREANFNFCDGLQFPVVSSSCLFLRWHTPHISVNHKINIKLLPQQAWLLLKRHFSIV